MKHVFRASNFFILVWIYQVVGAHFLIDRAGLELVYNITHFNHCLMNEFRLQMYVGRRLDDCIIACALRPHCKALTYLQHGSTPMCELFHTEDRGNVLRTGCVYIQKKDMNIKKIPCINGCADNMTCDVETKSCQHTECVNLPNITDGLILGNVQAVGNEIQFLCIDGFSREKRAVCQTNGEWSVRSAYCQRPKDCKELFEHGVNRSNVFRIFPVGINSTGIYVACDMDTPPGGWTIIQRRMDSRDFYRTWNDYKIGFGDKRGSYWLGNDNIWELTRHSPHRLRIDLTAQDGMTGYAEYTTFSIANETLQYKLNISGFRGDIGDSLSYHNQMKFTTKDRDNDFDRMNCGIRFRGGWWYKNCHQSNLNGLHMNNKYGRGIVWYTFRGHRESMKNSVMKIRPV